uniref:Putative secreted protein n=1 Tax=Anopheles darlingi TaxID=43151 RepID=A0A2M4DD94_ANODA
MACIFACNCASMTSLAACLSWSRLFRSGAGFVLCLDDVVRCEPAFTDFPELILCSAGLWCVPVFARRRC